MKPAAKPPVKTQETTTENLRPTISLQHVVATGTGSFGGWGPKVAGSGGLLKNWN
ncbi:MAG: hypothetical protein ABR508_00515 [Candidatus Baltobacteraceae bacterium]